MKSRSSAILSGTKPEVRPGRSRLQSTRPTVIRCRLSCLRMAAASCLTHWRAMSGRGRSCWSSVMNWTKCFPAKGAGSQSPSFRFPPGDDRLVHQVVAEDGGTVLAHGPPRPPRSVPARPSDPSPRACRTRPERRSCGSSPGRSGRGKGVPSRPRPSSFREPVQGLLRWACPAASMNLPTCRWMRTTLAPSFFIWPKWASTLGHSSSQ